MSQSNATRPIPPVTEQDHRSGPDDAAVTLVEYGDFQCEDSGAAYPVLKQIRADMGDSLRFVFRNFPLNHEHDWAQAAAEAAESAAAMGQFWLMHDALYEHQDDVRAGDIIGIASAAGLDVNAVGSDLESRRFSAKVDADHRNGALSGVEGTPTFFIDGERCDVGEDYAALEPILRSKTAAQQ